MNLRWMTSVHSLNTRVCGATLLQEAGVNTSLVEYTWIGPLTYCDLETLHSVGIKVLIVKHIFCLGQGR